MARSEPLAPLDTSAGFDFRVRRKCSALRVNGGLVHAIVNNIAYLPLKILRPGLCEVQGCSN